MNLELTVCIQYDNNITDFKEKPCKDDQMTRMSLEKHTQIQFCDNDIVSLFHKFVLKKKQSQK